MNVSEWVRAIHHYIDSLPPEKQIGYRHFSQREIAHIIDIAIDTLVDEFKAGGELRTHRLGRLRAITRPARMITNNLPDRSTIRQRIPARRTVRFKPSPSLLFALNAERTASGKPEG